MPAAKYNIVVEQGATFTRTITIKDSNKNPVDLTGWSLRGKIRATQNSASALATFTGTILNQGTNKGQGTVSLTAAETSAIPGDTSASTNVLVKSYYLYDIEAVRPDTSVVRILRGKVTLIPEITK